MELSPVALTPMTPEVERVIRERVDALPHGVTYGDHVFVGPYLLIAKRVLLAALGCDVSNDPLPIEPFAREQLRERTLSPAERKAPSITDGAQDGAA